MKNIAIIMSTYNGELYVVKQIESILVQENVNVTLYIRDDGSTDSTPILLKAIEMQNNNVYVTYGNNIGIGNSFMEELYVVPADYDYYAFADQDDYWMPEKLYNAVKKVEKFQFPVLYASNQLLVDESLKQLGTRFLAIPGIRYGDIIRGNVISGCTFVFNQELYKILIDKNNRPTSEFLTYRIHDAWVAMVAALWGEIIYDPNAYILYRQHDNNAVGARQIGVIEQWKLKIYRLFSKKSCQNGRIMSKELIRIFRSQLKEKEESILAFSLYSESIFYKVAILRFYNIFAHKGESKILYTLKVILNRL